MKRIFTFSVLIISAIIVFGCTTEDDFVVIQGNVSDTQTGDALSGATVLITTPAEFNNVFTRTDENGNYNLGDIDISEVTDFTLSASATGYVDAVRTVKIAPGDNITGFNFELEEEGSDDDQGSDDNGNEVGGESGGPAQIQLTNVTSPAINVAETGGITSTTFTFEVQDSAGRTVDRDYEVMFEIIRGPGGGEYITPEIGKTDNDGLVTSNLVSGDSSGTVRMQAVIEREDIGVTIRSTPVIVSISSGFPHPANFNVGPNVYNFDAYGLIDEDHKNNITASVGDLKGNPVKQGTAVYFSSKYGGLVNGSATTNENGFATVNLSANGSSPQDHPNGIGFIDVTAQTVDKDNNYIYETFSMLLTTPQAVISVEPDVMNVSNGGSQNFDVTITDLNGYPMAANTQIEINTGTGLNASGDIVSLQLGDYFQAGPGSTEFSVSISDADPDEAQTTDGSFTITVTSPSGAVTTKTIKGTRAKVNGN
ncbi:carboxypeptidase regulatory-like domain-containing protein [Gracilimonas tropica]|uniref:carboxypeptidase regulatory-like domain-containing protein n=1 Tax=Gracilimonas tropica TaxID=454600 RepID=UPI00039A48D9|nr:carboxypeptidase regulatory-like domain-containing protein [Gracilimonas tropica]